MKTTIFAVLLVVLLIGCSGGSKTADTPEGAAPPITPPSEAQPAPPDGAAPLTTPLATDAQIPAPAPVSCPDGQTAVVGVCVANGSENAACLADNKCNEGLTCSDKVCINVAELANISKLLPTPEEVPFLFPCAEHLFFDTPPSPTPPLVSLLEKVLLISDANARTITLVLTESHPFTTKEIQNLIDMPLAESFTNLANTIKEFKNEKENTLAKEISDMIIETRDYLNYLSDPENYAGRGENPKNYPDLVWGMFEEEPGANVYDPLANKIVINSGLEKTGSMPDIAAAIAHELTHWRDLFDPSGLSEFSRPPGGSTSIAQTEANAGLVYAITHHFTVKKTKTISIDWPVVTRPVEARFSKIAGKIVGHLMSDPTEAQRQAFFANPRIYEVYKTLTNPEKLAAFNTVRTAFDAKVDVGSALFFLDIRQLKHWGDKFSSSVKSTFRVGGATNPTQLITGTSGSKTGWPIPVTSRLDYSSVNAAWIVVLHIPNGFSTQVYGVKWPNKSPLFPLGSELFLKDPKSGKYQGNMGGVFDDIPEAGQYIVRDKKMLNLNPVQVFDPEEEPPDPNTYILPNSQWDLKKNDCGENADGDRNPIDYGCFLSCQKEINHRKNDAHLRIWQLCVEDLLKTCGDLHGTACNHYPSNGTSDLTPIFSCFASVPSCLNRDYYRDGPFKSLEGTQFYGIVELEIIDPKKVRLTFQDSGGFSGGPPSSTRETETYILRGGTWEGDLGGRIPLGKGGISQMMPEKDSIAFWRPDPSDPDTFTIQYGNSVTKLFPKDRPSLPGYRCYAEDDPECAQPDLHCDMPAHGPNSYGCKMGESCSCNNDSGE